MGALVLALWALLVSLDPAGRAREPGKNLSCYQCFKVRSPEFCSPVVCSSTDQVCVSHVLIITLRLPVRTLLSKRCAPRCPSTNMEFEWRSDSGVLSKIVRHCCSRSLCNRAPVLQEGPRALPWGLLLQDLLNPRMIRNALSSTRPRGLAGRSPDLCLRFRRGGSDPQRHMGSWAKSDPRNRSRPPEKLQHAQATGYPVSLGNCGPLPCAVGFCSAGGPASSRPGFERPACLRPAPGSEGPACPPWLHSRAG
ncbi:hypothetical protein R6Z07F_009415 [Ovis aries]